MLINMNRQKAQTLAHIVSDCDNGEGDVSIEVSTAGVRVYSHNPDGSEYAVWHIGSDGDVELVFEEGV